MSTLAGIGWHRVAAALFVMRLAVVLPMLATMTVIEPMTLALLVVAIHLLIAFGYWRRHRLAIWFGAYAALMSLVYPLLMPTLREPVPWFAVNTVFSAVLLAVALMAWRDARRSAPASG